MSASPFLARQQPRTLVTRYTAGMSTARWRTLPALLLPVRLLHATQDGVSELAVRAKLVDPLASHCGDPCIHVVQMPGGLLLVEDGHTRVVAAELAGRWWILARLLGRQSKEKIMPGDISQPYNPDPADLDDEYEMLMECDACDGGQRPPAKAGGLQVEPSPPH